MKKMKYVQMEENGDAVLFPGALANQRTPESFPLTCVVLSRMGTTFLWFSSFLAGTERCPVEHKTADTIYRATRDSEGSVYLISQSGSIAHRVGYTMAEIPDVLKEMLSGRGSANCVGTNAENAKEL